MNTNLEPVPASRFLADTHELSNLSSELCDYNMYSEDAALREAVQREGGAWAERELTEFGKMTGSADYLELGNLVNKYIPELETHDRFGKRMDLVKFHPAYHQLMKTAIEHGLHASPWSEPKPGAHVRRVPGIGTNQRRPVVLSVAALAARRYQEPDAGVAAQEENGQRFQRV